MSVESIARRQRTLIGLAGTIVGVNLFSLAWTIQDSRIVHGENERSKIDRRENRAAIHALEVRVADLERFRPDSHPVAARSHRP